MPVFVAMSALQGRPMASAFAELAALGAGIQLTPGNLPTPGFAELVAASGVATRRHHGFAWDARRTPVWDARGACLVASETVHPPTAGEPWDPGTAAAVEVMYPGQELGTGDAVERAMADGLALAVDISHVHIQRTQGAMGDATWRRLQDYPRLVEVHVSANAGRHDTHERITPATFGLAWARERRQDGLVVVLECYMHTLSPVERAAQLELVTR